MPAWTESLELAKTWVAEGFMVFGRSLKHTRGNDIVGPGHKDWAKRDFWVKFIESECEWRQHIFDGKAIRRGLKVQMEPPKRKLLVRSRSNGWYIDYGTKVEPPANLRDISRRAVKAIGSLYGAVDVLVGVDGKCYVLEVNLAPSLRDENTLAAYVNAIRRKYATS